MYSLKLSKVSFVVLIIFFITFLVPLQMFASNSSDYNDSYVVKQGDNITGVALLHNTTPSVIVKENAIGNPNLIYTGQKLSIPADKSNYLGSGFSFVSEPIAGYREANEKIAGYQFINDSRIVGSWKNVGTCVGIEDFNDTIKQQLEYIENNPSDNVYFAEYGDIKRGGDFAWSAGIVYNYSGTNRDSRYTITLIGSFKYMFLEYNQKNEIFDGIKNIPAGTKYIVFRKYEKVHMVKPGDTLNEIAEAFGTTADVIADMNNIKDINKLFVFQRLVMPYKN